MVMKDIVIGAIISSIFLIAMITFGANLAIDNNPNQSILKDERLGRLNKTITLNLDLVHEKAKSQQNATFGQTGEKANAGFILNFLPAIVTFMTMPITVWNILADGAQEILGIPGILLNLIGTVILISMIFLGWRVFKTGN